MHIKEHITASVAVSIGIYSATRSTEMAVVSFAAGVFLDIDHFIDYWLEHSFNLDMRKFFTACHECDFVKTRLVLHSAELLFLTATAAYFARSGLLTAAALGICQHLALDQLVNRVYPKSYLFLYRWAKGFRAEAAFLDASEGTRSNGNH